MAFLSVFFCLISIKLHLTARQPWLSWPASRVPFSRSVLYFLPLAFSHCDFFWCSPHFFLSVGSCGVSNLLCRLLNTSMNPQILIFSASPFWFIAVFLKPIFASSSNALHPAHPFFYFFDETTLFVILLIVALKKIILFPPQPDAVVHVHLIRCHLGPEDVVSPAVTIVNLAHHSSTRKMSLCNCIVS